MSGKYVGNAMTNALSSQNNNNNNNQMLDLGVVNYGSQTSMVAQTGMLERVSGCSRRLMFCLFVFEGIA